MRISHVIPYALRRISMCTLVYIMILGGFMFSTYAAPNAPTIAISPDTLYPLEEILYVEGRSDPNATVNAVLQKQGENPLRFTVKADQLGEWVIAEKVSMAKGDWELRARTVDGQEASEWSNPRIIRVVVTGFTLAEYQVSYLMLGALFFGIIIAITILIIILTIRARRLRKALIAKEALEIRTRAAEGFRVIRNNILEELRTMEMSPGNILSAADIAKKEKLLDELHHLEDEIEREVRDVENLT